jgi:hypothetical protein
VIVALICKLSPGTCGRVEPDNDDVNDIELLKLVPAGNVYENVPTFLVEPEYSPLTNVAMTELVILYGCPEALAGEDINEPVKDPLSV